MSGREKDHFRIVVRQHAARGVRETLRIPMLGPQVFRPVAHDGEAFIFEALCPAVGRLVPLEPRFVLFEAGSAIEQHQGVAPLGMDAMEGQRRIAAQRMPTDDRALELAFIKQAPRYQRPCVASNIVLDRPGSRSRRGRANPK